MPSEIRDREPHRLIRQRLMRRLCLPIEDVQRRKMPPHHLERRERAGLQVMVRARSRTAAATVATSIHRCHTTLDRRMWFA
mgnify:CR=1 FL=1